MMKNSMPTTSGKGDRGKVKVVANQQHVRGSCFKGLRNG